MGRNYHGDINGRFVFAVQSSDAADRFGVTGVHPNELYYHYGVNDLEAIETELKEIEKKFGEYSTPIITYHDLFGAEDQPMPLEKYLLEGGYKNMSEELWGEYYDYYLGRQILKCIKQHGCCAFTAEL